MIKNRIHYLLYKNSQEAREHFIQDCKNFKGAIGHANMLIINGKDEFRYRSGKSIAKNHTLGMIIHSVTGERWIEDEEARKNLLISVLPNWRKYENCQFKRK